VALTVLAHIHLNERVFIIKEKSRQRLGQLRFAHTRCPQEDKATDGPSRVLESGPSTPDRIGYGDDGLLLADDALAQIVLHPKQPIGLLLLQA